MPAPRYVTLTSEETRTLRDLSCADGVPCRTRQRATALRLSAQRWQVSQIARYLDWIEQIVRETMRRWEHPTPNHALVNRINLIIMGPLWKHRELIHNSLGLIC